MPKSRRLEALLDQILLDIRTLWWLPKIAIMLYELERDERRFIKQADRRRKKTEENN